MSTVTAVGLQKGHHFSKTNAITIRLLKGLGVAGDAHMGATVKHRSRVAKDPNQPNLRQVHLMHEELFDELLAKNFVVRPGEMGENVTTRGIDLLNLPLGTRLHLGDDAIVELTGLRNPCSQIEKFQKGLLAETIYKDAAGHIIRKTGVMSVVLVEGDVRAGDRVRVELPSEPHRPLQPV
jgi:MOSC domain-containing protein YiiM